MVIGHVLTRRVIVRSADAAVDVARCLQPPYVQVLDGVVSDVAELIGVWRTEGAR